MHIRIAQQQDVEQMLRIYAPHVTEGSASFELELPSVEAFSDRLHHYTQLHPWLVAVQQDEVMGYAYASPYRERKAYQWCVETSVYVHPNHQQSGVARALYTQLFSILHELRLSQAYAVITLPNPSSEAFHTKMGFIPFAVYEKVGYKFNQWHDVLWMKKEIGSWEDVQEPLPFSLWQKEKKHYFSR
jgi:L-amino acid N-acyltransferase YncA